MNKKKGGEAIVRVKDRKKKARERMRQNWEQERTNL